MRNSPKNKITAVKRYVCGYCVNKTKFLGKHSSERTKKFYAAVFLINHSEYGNILFDTGYSEEIYGCGMAGKLYNALNPTFVTSEDTVVSKLKRDNVAASDINIVILSHLHPDHIGCVKSFPGARLIISDDCLSEYRKGRLHSLIFKKMLPDDFSERAETIKEYPVKRKYFTAFDLFGDGSMLLTQTNGHFKGQLCLYLSEYNIFLGADTAWGTELMYKANEMSFFAKAVQNDFSKYLKDIDMLKTLSEEGVRIYLSHEDSTEGELTK